MTSTTLTFKNLTRNRLRLVLTLLAIGLPMFVFTITRSLVEGVQRNLNEADNNLRVAVHQKLTFTLRLPQRLREDIQNMAPEGYITSICRTTWFGGRVPGKQQGFPSMGVDRDTFAEMYKEYGLTAEDVEAFANERTGAIIARSVANQMNWKLGDRVTLKGSLPPYLEMEFKIVAIKPEIDSRGPWVYFALDYYDEAYQTANGNNEPIGVNNFWVKCSSPEAREWALREIDARFANSENETRTEMESTFFSAFLKSGGDWVGMIWNIGQLIVLVALAVAFNTMSMAFRERTREIAVLRALGFSAGRISRMVLSEGLAIGLIGGIIAVAPLWILAQSGLIEIPGLGRLQVPSSAALLSLAAAVLVGVLAALVPAVMAGRLRVAPALRKVA